MPDPIRILHLSDFHFREKTAWDSDPVLNALAEAVAAQTKQHGRPDLIAVTGDVAFSGKAAEYALATRWFREKLLPAAGNLSPQFLLIVPGNHDADRDEVTRGVKAIQQDCLNEGQDAIAEILQNKAEVELLLKRHTTFCGFVSQLTNQPMPMPWWGRVIAVKGVKIGVAGLCSSWMCYQDDEQGDLLVGRYQWNTIFEELKGAQLRLAMLHHPFSYMREFDGEELERFLHKNSDIILRGHLHKEKAVKYNSGKNAHLELAAGCTYESSTFFNGYQWIEIDPACMQARVRFYRWEDHEWIPHRNLYPDEPDFIPTFDLAAEPVKPDKDVAVEGENSAFINHYRQAYSCMYQNWELQNLGMAHTKDHEGRPIQAPLDDMYLPLRLAEGQKDKDKGKPLDVKSLLKRDRPLVIRGVAGAGKTTWMRYTFRALINEPNAFPLMVELRRLAQYWTEQGTNQAERLEDYLHDIWLAQLPSGDYKQILTRILSAEKGPRPVLLVDGWDELGSLGETLRNRLAALMKRCPRLLVVASSRPYGDGVPSHTDNFETLDIQNLSSDEIKTMTLRFYSICYAGELQKAQKQAEDLLEALGRVPEAAALAETPLLLTMLLFISRTSTLPDKRHQLYQRCVDNLLAELPDRYAGEGAQSLRTHWWPSDGEQRLRVVAALAFALQMKGYEKANSSTVVLLTRDETANLLPKEEDWVIESNRLKFINWLVDRAGLLTDRTDDRLAFAHLSFQEFLAALHLKFTVEGNEKRQELFLKFAEWVQWWETLRLWAALLERDAPEQMRAVYQGLTNSDSERFWLAGALFADGLGASDFPTWAEQAANRIQQGLTENALRVAGIWRSCHQDVRKRELAEILNKAARTSYWPGLLCLREWAESSWLKQQLESNRRGTIWLDAALTNETSDMGAIAAGRIWARFSPTWPGKPLSSVLLRNWWNSRISLAIQLQNLVLLGGKRDALLNTSKVFLCKNKEPNTPSELEAARFFANSFKPYFVPFFSRYFARDLEDDLAHDFARDFSRYFTNILTPFFGYKLAHEPANNFALLFANEFGNYFARGVRRDFNLYLQHNFTRSLTHDLGVYFAHKFANLFSSKFVQQYDLPLDDAHQLLAITEYYSFGGIGPRVFLTYATETRDPLIRLFYHAARLSYQTRVPFYSLEPTIELLPSNTDPLWPALARHLARIATPEDKALLEDLAAHPEKREGELTLGLQFYVRGDIMLEDGSILTLNQICDEIGLPHLPYLEDRPPELEIDWDSY